MLHPRVSQEWASVCVRGVCVRGVCANACACGVRQQDDAQALIAFVELLLKFV